MVTNKKEVITAEEQEKRNKKALLVILNACYECGNECIIKDGVKKCLWCDSEFVEGVTYGE